MPGAVTIMPVRGIGEVRPGDDVGRLIAEALEAGGQALQDGDVVVVTQKIVSKSEGRLADPAAVVPSPEAEALAAGSGRDPRHVELALSESRRVVRLTPRVLIVETRHGFVCANAGIDFSNVPGGLALLLPVDPDASARRIRAELAGRFGASIAVVISDTFGRPWRMGQTNVAIGTAGMAALHDYRGQRDDCGREMHVTEIAVADELASAAELVQNKTDRVPVAVIRGYAYPAGEGGATDLVRPADKDLFR